MGMPTVKRIALRASAFVYFVIRDLAQISRHSNIDTNRDPPCWRLCRNAKVGSLRRWAQMRYMERATENESEAKLDIRLELDHKAPKTTVTSRCASLVRAGGYSN